MKITVLVACATFCAILQIMPIGGSLNTQLDAVNERITVVEQLITELRERQYVGDIAKAIDGIASAEQNLTHIVDLVCDHNLDHIQDVFENSTAEGKDAAACQATMKSAYQTLKTDTSTEFGKCFEFMRNWLNTTANAVELKIQEAIQILSYLNLIFPSCYTTNSADIESCIVEALPNATEIVKVYNTTVVPFIKNKGYNQTTDEQVGTCFDAAARFVEEGCEALELNFEKCVEAL